MSNKPTLDQFFTQLRLIYRQLQYKRHQGPVSISDKMSYYKISQSLDAARFVFRIVALEFVRHLGSSDAEVPVKFQNDTNSLILDLAPWKL